MAATFEPTLRGTLPLVGGESQRSNLLEAYREAYNGARIVGIVVGETGSGRSRFLDEFVRDPALQRSFVVRLRLHRGDENREDLLLRDAVIDALETRPFLRRSLAEFIDQANSSAAGRVALGRVLETIARRLHLVVAIDDLDAVGSDGLGAIEEVLSCIQGDFMIIATMAPGFATEAESLVRYIGAEQIVVRLARLLPESLRDLIVRFFDFTPDHNDVQWLVDTTLGLPMLLREAISSLLRVGCIALHNGTWAAIHPFSRSSFTAGDALPSLRRRLEQLPDHERECIAMTAMLGRRAPIDATISLGLPNGWYASLVDRELIDVSGKFIEFTHDLFFETAISEARRLDLYARLRQQFDSLLHHDAIERGVRLPGATVRTILESSSNEDRPRLMKILLDAALELHRREDFLAATVYLEEVRRRWNEAALHLSFEDEIRFTHIHAACLLKAGRADEQMRLLREAQDLIQGDPSSPAVVPYAIDVLFSLAESEYREKRMDKAEACLLRATSLAEELPPVEREQRLTRVAYHRAMCLKTMDRHTDALDMLLLMVESINPDVYDMQTVDTIILLANISSEATKPHAELIDNLLERALAASERANEGRAVMLLRLQIAFEHYLRDRYDQFEPMARQLLTELHEHVLPRAESNLWFALAIIEAEKGNFERAIMTLDRCIALRWQTRSMNMWQLACVSRVLILIGSYRNEEAMETIELIEEDARRNRRHYRRFLLEIARAILEARKGAWSGTSDEIERLTALGNADRYVGIDDRLLQVRMEALLHASSIDPDEAEEIARQALELDPVHAFYREQIVLAAAAVTRAMGSIRNGRRRKLSPLVDELVERVVTVLDMWRATTPGMLRNYVPNLRQHVMPLMSGDVRTRLAEEMGAIVQVGAGIYDATLTAFGRLRVLDRDGIERGGRHFGTQKSDSKPRKLLAALVAGAALGRRETRERLVDMVWGEATSDDTAGNLFHVTLSGLRQVVGDVIDYDGSTYALNRGRIRVDVLDFIATTEEANAADRAGVTYRTYDLLLQACSLYSGEFLEGIYDEWCEGPREDLRSRIRAARLRLAELAIIRGDHDTARRTIRELMEADPADEEAMCFSLRLLDAEGERVRAIREYEEFSRRLRTEYQVSPSRRLQEMRQALQVGG